MAGASGPTATFGRKRKIWDMPDGELVDVPLDSLHDNPFNPRVIFDEEEITALAASIRAEKGLLQELSIAAVEPFLEFWRDRLQDQPETLEKLEKGLGEADPSDYVILIGHNRTRALRQNGDEFTTAKLANGKIPRARILGLPENLRRIRLNPLEEALGFQGALDDGFTQTDVAEQVGCKQPHISKRLKLLKLPQPIQQAVLGGLQASEAELLLDKLPSDEERLKALDLMQSERIKAAVAVAKLTAPPAPRQSSESEPRPAPKVAASTPAAAAEEETADSDGAAPSLTPPVVINARENSPADAADKFHSEQADSSSRQPAGAPVPARTDDSDTAGTSEATVQQSEPEPEPEPTPAEVAALQRRSACQTLVLSGPSGNPRETVRVLAPALLLPGREAALQLAFDWLQGVPESHASKTRDHIGYFASISARGEAKLTERVAFAVALATAELRASQANHDWDAQDRAYVTYLTESVSYQPTAWDQARLGAN